ncbi:MAG: type II secretion system protein GspG [Planctomycetota bacterium]
MLARPVNPSRRRGFSLLELMLVLGILGVLMAVAAVNVLGGQQRANIRATEASMRTVSTAITEYATYHSGSFPTTLDALVGGPSGGYLSSASALNDAWGNPFYYQTPGLEGRPYALASDGPDGQPGTEDDLDYWIILDKDTNDGA